jgi:hypothetical protein
MKNIMDSPIPPPDLSRQLTIGPKNETQTLSDSINNAASSNAITNFCCPLCYQVKKDINNFETSSIATTSGGTHVSDSDSDSLSTTSDVSSASSALPANLIDFNNRSPEARDARLANSIFSLDEDIPQDIDNSIKEILKNHTERIIVSSLDFLDDKNYLEYKQQMAAKRIAEKNLPKSKGRSIRQ